MLIPVKPSGEMAQGVKVLCSRCKRWVGYPQSTTDEPLYGDASRAFTYVCGGCAEVTAP